MAYGQLGIPASYWAPHAWVAGGVADSVRLGIARGRIETLEIGAEPQLGDERLPGLVMPGAANCHSHTFQRALRGLGGAGATFWSWRTTMYAVANRLTPELYRQYARAVYEEMLLAGYTTVAEFHYVHHQWDGTPHDRANAMGEALAEAAQEAGIRLTLLDTCYLRSNIDGDPVGPEQRRFSDGTANAWSERMDALDAQLAGRPGVRVGAAIHSVRACQPAEAEVVAEWTRAHGCRPLHLHLSEQPDENEACQERFGCSPTELLAASGIWGPSTVAVHATHVSDSDVATMAAAGSSVVLCPSTEADLADGLPPTLRLRDAGVRIGIGSDENVTIDPFDELRRIDTCARLTTGKRDLLMPADLVRIACANGQAICGWPECGALGIGAPADFVVLSCESPRTSGATPDGVPMVASSADVRDVFVAGERVVRDGRSRLGDPARELSSISELLRGGDA